MSVHIPEKILVGKITQGTTTVVSYWSGGTYDGAPLTYQATFEIQSVAAGYPGYYNNANLYNANDIEVGWQFLLPNGKWYDIIGISTGVTDNSAILEIRDTNLRILTSDANNDPPNNGPDENSSGILCPVVNGVAQLSNLAKFAGAFPIDSYWVDDMQAAGTNYIVANGGGEAGSSGTSGTSGSSGTSGQNGISAGRTYYFNQSETSDVAGYKVLDELPTTGTTQTVTTTLTNTQQNVLVESYITPELGFNLIPAGVQRFQLHLLKPTSNDDIDVYVTLQLANSTGGTIGSLITSSANLVTWNGGNPAEVYVDVVFTSTQIDPTSRMIVKIYLNNNESSSKSVNYYAEGTAYSYVITSVGVVAGTSGTSGTSGSSGDSLFVSGAGFWYTTNNLEVTGSVKIKGTLTADEYNVSLFSSSILYSSGSTKFGDTQDDTHVFTGSLVTTGSLTINGDLTVNGTSILKAIDNRESLIVSGAMNIVSNNVNASVVSASLAFESVKAIEQIINTTTMDLGYF